MTTRRRNKKTNKRTSLFPKSSKPTAEEYIWFEEEYYVRVDPDDSVLAPMMPSEIMILQARCRESSLRCRARILSVYIWLVEALSIGGVPEEGSIGLCSWTTLTLFVFAFVTVYFGYMAIDFRNGYLYRTVSAMIAFIGFIHLSKTLQLQNRF